MIKCNLLKFSFLWNFQNEMIYKSKSNFFWYSKIVIVHDCVIETREVFSFLPPTNNSVTIELSALLPGISTII